MKSQYPTLPERPTNEEVTDWIREVVRLRQTEDVSDFTNLPNIYLRGRITTRVPTSSGDVLAVDTEGDVCFTDTYMYRLTDVSGILAWRRVALASW